MWNALSFFVSNIWEVLDDVLIAVLVLVIGSSFARLLHHVVHDLLRYSMFVADLMTTTVQGFLFGVCLYQLLGVAAVNSFVGGFSIGIGYAMQPYIISMFNGAALFSLYKGGRVRVGSDDKVYNVDGIGLFFTRLETDDGLLLIPNTKMLSSRLEILKKT